MWALTAAVEGLVVVAVAVVVGPVTDWLPVPWWAIGLIVLVAVGYAGVVPRWRYAVHRWEVTDTAVYTQTGWWARERRIAPMSRIQTVDHAEGAISRLFGLATVTVTTASAAGALEIEGLDRVRALPPGRRAHPDGRQRARGRHVNPEAAEWHRLDPRMLLVYPVKEFVRFLPALIALFIAGSASGGTGEWWQALAVVIPVASVCCATTRPATGSRPAGSSCAAGCSTGTCSRLRWTGCGPSTSPRRPSTGCSG